MKIYELELRLKDCFLAKNKKEAKREMLKRLRHLALTDNYILGALYCKEKK